MTRSHAALIALIPSTALLLLAPGAHAQDTPPPEAAPTEPPAADTPAPITEETIAVLVASSIDHEPLARRIEEQIALALTDKTGRPAQHTAQLRARAGYQTDAGLVECVTNATCRQRISAKLQLTTFVIGDLQSAGPDQLLNLSVIHREQRADQRRVLLPLSEDPAGRMNRIARQTESLRLTPPPAEPHVGPPLTTPRGVELSAFGWTGVGTSILGAATLAVGGVFFWRYTVDSDLLRQRADSPIRPEQRGEILDAQESINTSAQTSNLLLGAGATLTLIGATFIVWDVFHGQDQAPVESLQLSIDPFSSTISAGVTF